MSRESKKTPLLIALIFTEIALTFYLAASGPGSLGFVPAQAHPLPATNPLIGPGISVFFTDPRRDNYHGGPETGLLAAIDAARVQVDIAAYDLNLWGLRDALLAAHRRGVLVRMVVEADQRENSEIEALAAGGIPVISDRPDGLMHDKFVIIDRRQVWMGSMNFTLNGAYRNDNHLVAIHNPGVAALYMDEFEEMFIDGLFGAYSPPGQAASFDLPGLQGAQVRLEIYFSPDDGAAARILTLIEAAKESIHFLAFSFTADAIGQAMIDRAAGGVLVQGVFDESQLRSNIGSEFDYLLAAGAGVRVDGNPNKMHHKFIVIDRKIVIAGSYNFSISAETRNDENMLIVFDEAIAEVFLTEWERVFALGRAEK